MTDIKYIDIPDNQYGDAVVLEEYNGIYSLVAGTTNDEGKTFKKWAFPQTKNREPGKKAIPVKVQLGDQHSAAEILRGMADEIDGGGGDMSEPDHSQFNESGTDDDIPF
ncbi:MAG: hypothetical protein ACQEQ0_09755 [Bacteroidota bacterium]